MPLRRGDAENPTHPAPAEQLPMRGLGLKEKFNN